MRTRMGWLYIGWVLLAAAVWPAWGQKTPYDLKYKEIHYEQIKPDTIDLPNGMQVYLLEDHELPVVYGYAIIKTGGLYEPLQKSGLAQLTGTLLRTGGCAGLSGDSLDKELEFMASSITSGISREMGEASLFSLGKNFDRTLRLFAAILRQPAFADNKIELERNKTVEDIRRRWDDPAQTAGIQFDLINYGPESPWAAIDNKKNISAITKDDIRVFYQKYYQPNNIKLGFCGDFKKAELRKKIETLFGDWPARPVDFPSLGPIQDRRNPGVYFVEKDINQFNVHIGHLGINRFDKNWFKVQLFNEIFGYGGFSCRLMKEVRSNKGLAYVVYGGIGSGTDRGLFDIFCQTKSTSMFEAINTIRDVITGIQAAPVTDDELERAKKSFINSFVFKFDSGGKVLYRKMYLDYFGYPADFDNTYLDHIRAVTKQDVQQVAGEYMRPDKLVYVIVGKKDLLTGDLNSLGKITPIVLEPDTTQ